MPKFLGEEPVNDLAGTPYATFDEKDWAFHILDFYGCFDGGHHKAWAIDQAMRVLKGTQVIVKIARWDDGQSEYRFTLDEPSQEYLDYVKELEAEGYEQDVGIPP